MLNVYLRSKGFQVVGRDTGLNYFVAFCILQMAKGQHAPLPDKQFGCNASLPSPLLITPSLLKVAPLQSYLNLVEYNISSRSTPTKSLSFISFERTAITLY